MSYLWNRCRCQLFFVISSQVLFIECLLHSIRQITSFSSVVYSIFCSVLIPNESNSFSHQLYFSGCSALPWMEWLRLLCYLTDLIYHAYNKISVRVRFLFVFLQFSSSNEHHSTLIASYLRRIASCSRSYLWDQECFQSYLSSCHVCRSSTL